MAFYDTMFPAEPFQTRTQTASVPLLKSPMKLVSSSPKTRHAHSSRPGRSWIWTQIRSRLSSTKTLKWFVWILLVMIVAVFAFAIFHQFAQTLDAVAHQQ